MMRENVRAEATPQSPDTRKSDTAEALASSHTDEPIRKRRKITRACDLCKSKKKRCTGDIPCGPCQRSGSVCTYDTKYSRGTASSPTATTTTLHARDDSIRSISPISVADHVQSTYCPPRYTLQVAESTLASNSGPSPRHDAPLQLNHHQPDQPFSNIGNGISEPPSRRLSPEPSEPVDGQYHGPSSAHSFLGRAWRKLDRNTTQAFGFPKYDEIETQLFSFGDRKIRDLTGIEFSWPSRHIVEGLIQQYFDFASPTYRFLHQPTVLSWIERAYTGLDGPLSNSRKAILLILLASVSHFKTDYLGNTLEANEDGWQQSEVYFLQARRLLEDEKGPPILESVQARFAAVQYLLSSSRPNNAMYTFGSVVQLLQALGLHRKRNLRPGSTAKDTIKHECSKRMFWCAFTLDKYLSTIMGRPPMLRLDDTNQDLPTAINDEDIESNSLKPRDVGRDCLLNATIAHAQLAQVLAKAYKEQYGLTPIGHRAQIVSASDRLHDLAVWQSSLTPLLSGAIRSSSLIPPFRRQHSVLQLAHLHATMFVTRTLILRDFSTDLDLSCVDKYKSSLKCCITAAYSVVDIIASLARVKQFFPTFWYMQYIGFNAISILYIYLIQCHKQRIPRDDSCLPETQSSENAPDTSQIFQHACLGQFYLAQASNKNAPAWRYSLILEGLKSEAQKTTSETASNGRVSDNPDDRSDTNRQPYRRDNEQTVQQSPYDQGSGMQHTFLPTLNAANVSEEPWLMNMPECMFTDLMDSQRESNTDIDSFWSYWDSLPIGETGFPYTLLDSETMSTSYNT